MWATANVLVPGGFFFFFLQTKQTPPGHICMTLEFQIFKKTWKSHKRVKAPPSSLDLSVIYQWRKDIFFFPHWALKQTRTMSLWKHVHLRDGSIPPSAEGAYSTTCRGRQINAPDLDFYSVWRCRPTGSCKIGAWVWWWTDVPRQ